MNKFKPILLTLGYSFPYVYFSFFMDYYTGLMIGYLFMLLVLVLLFRFSLKLKTVFPLIVGSILSTVVSISLINYTEHIEEWSYYFKPFWPNHLAITLMVIALIIQLIVYFLSKRKNS